MRAPYFAIWISKTSFHNARYRYWLTQDFRKWFVDVLHNEVVNYKHICILKKYLWNFMSFKIVSFHIHLHHWKIHRPPQTSSRVLWSPVDFRFRKVKRWVADFVSWSFFCVYFTKPSSFCRWTIIVVSYGRQFFHFCNNYGWFETQPSDRIYLAI